MDNNDQGDDDIRHKNLPLFYCIYMYTNQICTKGYMQINFIS